MISSISSQSFRLKKSDMKHYKQLINKKVMLNMNEYSHTVKMTQTSDLLKAYRFDLIQPNQKEERNNFWISTH